MILRGDLVHLRPLEPDDVELLYQWENDPEHWRVSNTLAPFSRHILEQYVHSVADIYANRQLRLMICMNEGNVPVGCIDLFEFEPHHQRAGVGILIGNQQHRQQGIGSEALAITIRYSFQVLFLHQLFCNIGADNEASVKLFEKHGFKRTGVKNDWIRQENIWTDEYHYQLLNPQD